MHKVMVVENDEDILFVVSHILQHNGYTVFPVSKCEEAIPAALENKPDLIMFEINLGRCDGRKLCLKLRTDYSSTIPILLFSDNVRHATTVNNYMANAFIVKPFSVQMLIDTINEQLNN